MKKFNILIVDDIEENIYSLKLLIEESFDLNIFTAKSANEAMEILLNNPMDLILMDVQMPHMDGYKATKTIRELSDEGKAHIPIVALTANAFEEDRKMAISKGMNDHIAKPIDVKKVEEVIISVLK